MFLQNDTASLSNKLRLIIVDDEPMIRSGLVDLFPWDALGYDVVGQFDHGKQAFDYVQANPVDVILTDIRMPIMDGITLAKSVREINLDVIIVFLSSYTEFEYARQGLLHGVRDYIVKPVKYQVLIETFTKLYESTLMKIDNPQTEPSETEEIAAPYQGYYSEIISSIKSYVKENLDTASLETAAAQVGFTPNYISRIFHKYAQITFSDYLLTERMKMAASLLHDINIKLYEVSQMVGYDNAKSFSRAFSQYYGTTPTEFRKQSN